MKAQQHRTGAATLASVTSAGSIAVVGASERNLIARIALDNLRRRGFGGRVIGVHPSARAVEGFEVVTSLSEAGSVDVALLALGARNLIGALDDAGSAGIGTVIVPGAGANEGGREIEEELRAASDRHGVAVIGPNCMGVASLPNRVVPYVGTLDPDFQEGRVALVSQSGSVCELFTALPYRVGFSHVLSLGNEMGIDTADALEFLATDARTEVVALFVEGIRRPREFREALWALGDADKPVVALKVGRSERAEAGTVAHTGVLAGDAEVFSAVLRDAGAIEVGDLDEMLVALELLGKALSRPAGRVVYAGDSGGEANLFADLAATHGIDLPPLRPETLRALREPFPSLDPQAGNPLDLWAVGDPEATYRDGISFLVEHEPHLVVFGVDKFLARTEPELAFVRAGVGAVREPGAVVLMAFAGSDSADLETLRACWERRIPVVRGAGATLSALARIARRERRRDRTAGERPAIDAEVVRSVAAATAAWSEHAAKQVLRAAGIPVTEEHEVSNVDAAVDAAREIGFPVVAKIGGETAHKSELRGVRLGLRTEDDVREAAAALLALGPSVLVAEQRSAQLELIVGAFRDEQFGPCALVGLGGIWTEALRETAVVAGPGSPRTVAEALEGLAVGRLLLEGGRGRGFPAERVIDVTLRLLDTLAATADLIDTIEINPLFVDDAGVVAVDALVVPRKERR